MQACSHLGFSFFLSTVLFFLYICFRGWALLLGGSRTSPTGVTAACSLQSTLGAHNLQFHYNASLVVGERKLRRKTVFEFWGRRQFQGTQKKGNIWDFTQLERFDLLKFDLFTCTIILKLLHVTNLPAPLSYCSLFIFCICSWWQVWKFCPVDWMHRGKNGAPNCERINSERRWHDRHSWYQIIPGAFTFGVFMAEQMWY